VIVSTPCRHLIVSIWLIFVCQSRLQVVWVIFLFCDFCPIFHPRVWRSFSLISSMDLGARMSLII
jgi:hypothetical protein